MSKFTSPARADVVIKLLVGFCILMLLVEVGLAGRENPYPRSLSELNSQGVGTNLALLFALFLVLVLWLHSRLLALRYRREQQEWRRLTENLPDVVMRLDKKGRLIFVSPSAENLMGLKPESMVGRHYRDARLHKSLQESIDGCFFEANWSGRSQADTISLPGPTGLAMFRVRYCPERDDRGQVVGTVILAQDITRRHIEVLALQDNERQLREIFENIDEVFWLRTRERFLYVSPAYEHIFGFSREELYHNPAAFLNHVHRNDHGEVERAFARNSTATFEPVSMNFRVVRPDGSIRWIYLRSFLVGESSPDADDIRMAGIFVDVTHLASTEAQLEQTNRRFEQFMDSLPAWAYIRDAEERLVFVNQQMREMLNTDDYLGRRDAEVLPEHLAESLSGQSHEVLEKNREIRALYSFDDAHGQPAVVDVIQFPLLQADGQVWVGVMCFDLTERGELAKHGSHADER